MAIAQINRFPFLMLMSALYMTAWRHDKLYDMNLFPHSTNKQQQKHPRQNYGKSSIWESLFIEKS